MLSKYIKINNKMMHYLEEGSGELFLFLHGNPSSSYLWRDIITKIEGRALALDLIGMGKSEKLNEYSFESQYRYLDEFIKKMELKNIILVLHDWGSALGFHYFKENSEKVKGIVFMEAIIKTHSSYDAMGDDGNFFRMLRDPVEGRTKVIDENFFIEEVLQGGTMRKLKDEEHDFYRKPYLNKEDREILLMWPNLVSIAGKPENTTKIIEEYMEFLYSSETPKLLLYANPGAIIRKDQVEELKNKMRNLSVKYIGEGIHFLQEDNPEKISEEISKWYDEKL